MVQLSHPHLTTGKNIALTIQTFVGKIMSLLFNMLSRLVITFLSRGKCLLISWLQSPSAVILESPKISVTLFPLVPHLFAKKWWDWMSWYWFSECWVLRQLFHSLLSLSSRGSLVILLFLPYRCIICISEVMDISPSNLDSSLCFIQPSISHDVLCI